MFGGFFDKMYYGDPRKPDLGKEDVKNVGRFKLFFTVLQVRFWKLVQLNLMYVLFWIPTFFLVYTQALVSIKLQEPLSLLFFLLLIPCLLLTGPATAGITYVIRNWARDEHAWIWSDFKDAWKQNWKESLIIMLINGLALMLFYVNIRFYRGMVAKSFGFLVLYYFIWCIGIIYSMMNMFIFPMLVTYTLNVRQILKNAFIFTMAELPRTLGIFALAVGIFIATFELYTIPVFIIGFTLPALVVNSYTNWVFDKYINKRLKQQNEAQDEVEELE